MYQYSDSISCTCPEDKSMFFIEFLQNAPDLSSRDNNINTKLFNVSSVMMEKNTALRLAQAILELFSENYTADFGDYTITSDTDKT